MTEKEKELIDAMLKESEEVFRNTERKEGNWLYFTEEAWEKVKYIFEENECGGC